MTSYHTYENWTFPTLDSHSNLLQFMLNETLTRLHARQSARTMLHTGGTNSYVCRKNQISSFRWHKYFTAVKHTAVCAFWQNLLVQHRPTFPSQSWLLVSLHCCTCTRHNYTWPRDKRLTYPAPGAGARPSMYGHAQTCIFLWPTWLGTKEGVCISRKNLFTIVDLSISEYFHWSCWRVEWPLYPLLHRWRMWARQRY